MKKLNRFACLLFLIALAVSQVCPATASANEVWVTPAVLNSSKVVGNWALTGTGYTRFSFVVPDNFTGLPEAKVVVLGQGSAPVTITYSLALSISGDGFGVAQRTYNQAGVNANIEPNVFTEIDVTSILPTDIPLSPGDYVSLYFNTTTNAASANIMGLRFIYSEPGIPRGAIMMWSGNTAPSGWALCDGENGTPDLRERFVLGAGGSVNKGSVGGNSSITIPAHVHATGDHVLTVEEMPSHTHIQNPHNHYIGVAQGPDWNGGTGTGAGARWGSYTSDTTATNQNTGGNAPHNHGNTSSAGDEVVNVMPPYYALCFIMKL